MNHCVPDGEVDFGDFDALTPVFPSDLSKVKSKWVSMQHTKKSLQEDMAFVPDHDFADPTWADVALSTQFVGNTPGKKQWQMQGKDWQVQGKDWQVQSKDDSEWITAHHLDAVTPTVPIGLEKGEDSDGNDDHDGGDHNIAGTNFRDDELESWLQYPLDELDHQYGNDMWGDLPPNSPPKEAVISVAPQVVQNTCAAKQAGVGGNIPASNNPQAARAANAAAALALGAQRAAGLISPSADPFCKVRASSLPTITTFNGRWGSGAGNKPSGPLHGMSHGAGHVDMPRDFSNTPIPASCGMPAVASSPPKAMVYSERGSQQGPVDWSHLQASVDRMHQEMHPTTAAPPSSGGRNLPLNFSHFSRPAAMYSRANLQNMGAALCGKADLRAKTEGAGGVRTNSFSCTSSVAESTAMTGPLSSSAVTQSRPCIMTRQGAKQASLERFPIQNGSVDMAGLKMPSKTWINSELKQVQAPVQESTYDDVTEQGLASTVTSGGHQGLDKRTALYRRGSLETTVTSSCGAESSGRPNKEENQSHMKGKRGREEETEFGQSEDVMEESVDAKKGASSRGGNNAAKRSRAAEVHNLSERRRRDRINERMKALQELIPNSNKTDKASMLDEAIEYLKMLQLQLQVMSMRTGVGMNPLLPGQGLPGQSVVQMPLGMHGMPPGMNMVGMPGMGHLAGMGPMGMPPSAMNYQDMGAMPGSLPPQRHSMDLSAYSHGPVPGPASRHGSASAAGLMDGAHPRQLIPSSVDPLGAYIARQQMQQSQVQQQTPVSLEMYQAYLMQQQQQSMGQPRQ